MNRKNFYSKKLAISSILLDKNNPRIRVAKDQKECIELLFKNSSEKAALINLAKHIAKNGITIDPIVVSKDESGKYVVRDGNRRIAALKMLLNPKVCPDETTKKTFNNLKNQFSSNIPSKIEVFCSDDENSIIEYIELKHTGENNGIGQRRWSAVLQSYFGTQHGKSTQYKRAAQLLLWMELRNYFFDSDFPISTLSRFLSTSYLSKIGFKIESDILTTENNKLAFEISKSIIDAIKNGQINVGRNEDNDSVINTRDAENILKKYYDQGVMNYEAMIKDQGTQSQGTQSQGTQSQGTQSQGTQSQGTQSQGKQDQGKQDQGKQDQGTQGQGTQDQGTQDPGTQDPGTQDQGTQSQGTQDPGTQSQGTQSQGKQDQGTQGQGTQDPGTQDQGTQDQGTQDQGTQDQTKKGRRTKGPTMHSTAREFLVSTKENIGFNLPQSAIKCSNIIVEMQQISIKNNPIAIAGLMRIFLESSVEHYIKKHNVQMPQNKETKWLNTKVIAAARHMVSRSFIDHDYQENIIMYSNLTNGQGDNIVHIRSLQASLHHDNFYPQAEGLISLWDGLLFFFEICWTK